ncbi:MAG: hypothetical protein ACR2KT_03710 [Methylocella sp.]
MTGASSDISSASAMEDPKFPAGTLYSPRPENGLKIDWPSVWK